MCTTKVDQLLQRGKFALAVGELALPKTGWKDQTASLLAGSCTVQTGLKWVDPLALEINQGGNDVSNDCRVVANCLKLGVESLDIAED